MKKIGFIGMGNMAQAIAASWVRCGAVEKENLFAFAPHYEKLCSNAARIGFVPCRSASALVESVDTVVMACKPHQIEGVLADIGEALMGKSVISIALGWDFARYTALLPELHVQFVMPNTPALVGEGVLLFEEVGSLEESERREAEQLFARVGRVTVLPSHLMAVGGALTGCGPAFVDMMMEAFADAAVKYGIPREQAYVLTSQMILGSALLQRETGTPPAVLKDAVCSPAGSTIRGVEALEKAGFRAACMAAIAAAVELSK